ncbi:MAG: ABATE domain-containing protein [Rhodocyclaceae bacterium]|nr:ABATE domain-containing protein [Rhodocyclaceae bacterium]
METRDTADTARPDAFRVGDHPALDFLNTLAAPRGTPIEWLASGQDLLDWLVGAQLLSSAEATRLASTWPATDIDAAAREAARFREWLRDLVARLAGAGPSSLRPADVHRVNELLSRESGYAALVSGEGSPDWRVARRHRWERPDQLLVLVAAPVADLLAASDWGLVRQCENPQCTIWFYDRTKAHRRRWCSQAACGNRAKVAAFRARQRGDD